MRQRLRHCFSRSLGLLLLAALTACSQSPSAREPTESQVAGKAVVIFIPGYKGSALADRRSGDRLWITASEGLFGSTPLSLASERLGLPRAPALRTDGVLRRVRLVPGLYDLDVYGSWLDWLGEKRAVVPFAYDWRQSNVDSARELGKLVQKVKRLGATSVDLVAHSMGGLVAAYYLRYGGQPLATAHDTWEGASQVRRVVIGVTPFGGSLRMLISIVRGSDQGLNTEILSREALASFPASYQLLPTAGDVADVPLFAAKTWIDQGWGLFGEALPNARARAQARQDYLTATLHEAARFAQLLAAPVQSQPQHKPRLLFFIGDGHATAARAHVHGGKLTVTEGNGDGIVLQDAARPPGPLLRSLDATVEPVGIVHEALYNTEAVRERVLQFLGDAH